ncbi:metallophosphoesterase [Cyanobacterium stanieri LEGE 03274]|uniref:Metallophosphoesterase n=1 Tax=Cyanobacterium stanieri LEGE 03274 TaxID=1828756 RepID=A0ABR9V7J0_9CHRO|nr:metallophosphoesterase [Cyanobacterium stanieri]MBE9223486.1 metallophosphoesterase [Cyanobacterium stanieri LEGE 03274]
MKKILQITDTHLDEELTTHGYDVYGKLSLVLRETIEKEDFDLIIFSGDITDKGSLKAYQWLAEKTKKYQDKIIWMAGNHDNIAHMEKALNFPFRVKLEKNKLNYQLNLNGVNILCLDTSEKSLSLPQINWLIESTNENTITFIHHPPMICGSGYMDKNHSLQNQEMLTEKLLTNPNKLFRFFCGHYHQESCFLHKNIQMFLTPSTMFQIDKYKPYFQISNSQSGYRIIEIYQDKSIKTYCNYIHIN